MNEFLEDFIPKQGDIIRLYSGCGVVLDVFKNEKGDAILKVLFAKNVVKLQEPGFLPLDLAYSMGMQLADKEGFFLDFDDHKRWYQEQLKKRLQVLETAIIKP